jgi:C4-type Zn-finger protein
MANYNFLSILKTITEAMSCPSCGHTYDLNEVQFVSQMDSFSMVHLTSKNCQKPVWVNFFATDSDPQMKVNVLQRTETFLDMEEISSDEVISFHEELKTFDGNFKKVFNR